MAHKNDDNEQERNSNSPSLTPVLINRTLVLPDLTNQIGGIIQPVNPHFSGYSVVADIETEDPDVQWIPNPGLLSHDCGERSSPPNCR